MVDALVTIDRSLDGVAIIEMHRPPHNFIDPALVRALADAYESVDDENRCLVLCSEGRNFCAGADFNGVSVAEPLSPDEGTRALYQQAVRLFATHSPVVAAVQGAAVGGGFGLALSADFRVAGESTRFVANFARLGLHHGFGMTVTLPAVVGQQRALELLYVGGRIDGAEASRLGVADRLVDDADIRREACSLATDIAASAPLAVRSIRATMRATLAERVRAATDAEQREQRWLRSTRDHAEGVRAVRDRRPARFIGA